MVFPHGLQARDSGIAGYPLDADPLDSCHLQLNRGAAHLETDFALKCKVPFGKARGPAQAPNRRTSHIRGWRYAPTCGVKGRVSDKNGTPLLRDLTANDSSTPSFEDARARSWKGNVIAAV